MPLTDHKMEAQYKEVHGGAQEQGEDGADGIEDPHGLQDGQDAG